MIPCNEYRVLLYRKSYGKSSIWDFVGSCLVTTVSGQDDSANGFVGNHHNDLCCGKICLQYAFSHRKFGICHMKSGEKRRHHFPNS